MLMGRRARWGLGQAKGREGGGEGQWGCSQGRRARRDPGPASGDHEVVDSEGHLESEQRGRRVRPCSNEVIGSGGAKGCPRLGGEGEREGAAEGG